MKQFTLLFFGIIITSIVTMYILSISFNIYLFPATNYNAKKDTAVYKKTISNLFSVHAAFDEKYYRLIAQDELSYDQQELVDMAINIKNTTNSDEFTSITSKQIIDKIIEYSTNAMLAKAILAKSDIKENEFIKAFDSLEYNIVALIAMMNIAEKIYGVKINNSKFIPSTVTQMLIEKGSCNKVIDEYEGALTWFISYTSLKASYDVLYMQLLFGSNFYSKLEISNILKRMNEISLIMNKCLPPNNIFNKNLKAFQSVEKSYNVKKNLAEYNFVATIPNEEKIRKFIYTIYSTQKMTNVMYETIGFDSFKTLSSIAIFELYLFTAIGKN